jgi:hypothetical protein
MPIIQINYPNALPVEKQDFVKQNNLIETGFLRVNDPWPVVGGNIVKGAVFQLGGSVYIATSNTAIAGVPSDYVKLTPSGDGSTCSPEYVANLAGVSWNDAYNGYYDVAGNLYVFDEGLAFLNGQISTLYTKLSHAINGARQQLFHAEDQKAGGTNGGTFTTGAWRTRDLNTLLTNEIIGAGLAGNQITLPAGTFWAEWSCPAFQVYAHKSVLYNVSDAAVVGIGCVSFTADTVGPTTHSFGSAKFTIDTEKTLELRHICSSTRATYGFGTASIPVGLVEVYSSVKIWKTV